MQNLVDFVEKSDMWAEPYVDILNVAPQTSIDDAYRVQVAMMKRRVERGDTIIGYKAAGTTRKAQNLLGEQPYPILGTLLRSQLIEDGGTYEMREGRTYVEAEVGVLLRRDLSGPGVTYLDALAAVDCYVPIMEIAPWSPAAMAKKRSFQQVIATQKLNGGVVIGRERISPSAIDLRYEGAVVEVDDEVVATGAGAEVMGDPINVVVIIANNMAKYGVELKAGMLIMTGSVAEPFAAESNIKNARVTFTRMGNVRAQFVRR